MSTRSVKILLPALNGLWSPPNRNGHGPWSSRCSEIVHKSRTGDQWMKHDSTQRWERRLYMQASQRAESSKTWRIRESQSRERCKRNWLLQIMHTTMHQGDWQNMELLIRFSIYSLSGSLLHSMKCKRPQWRSEFSSHADKHEILTNS